MSMRDVETNTLAAAGLAQGLWKYIVRPSFTAKAAWLTMGAGIVAYEMTAPTGELLSEGADRALEAHPIITRLGIAAVALHLMNALPTRYDPLHQSMEIIKRL